MTEQAAAADLALSPASTSVADALPSLAAGDAQARLAALSADRDWSAKFLDGNQAARREFEHLSSIVANGGPVDMIDAVMAGTPPAQAFTGDGLPNYRDMAAAAVAFRDIGISDGASRQVLEERKVSRAEQDMARAWLKDHQSNAEWRGKLLAGDNEARRQFTLASIILSSEVEDAAA